MNFVVISGRLTKDPEVRFTGEGLSIARYTLAVDRPKRKDQEAKADFFNCTAFGKNAEFAEKYLKKGTKILLDGSMQQDNYTGKDGKTVYAWQLIVNHQEFCESRKEAAPPKEEEKKQSEFMDIPDGLDDEQLPFNF